MTTRTDQRQLTPRALLEALREARKLTLAYTSDLSDEQWRVPFGPYIQPTAWDLSHIGWFAEFFVLRGPHTVERDGAVCGQRAPQAFGPDQHLDSARVLHPMRWEIDFPPRDELHKQLRFQLEACCRAVEAATDDDTLHFAQLALYHELMHTEALAWTRAMLSYPAPPGVAMPKVLGASKQVRIDAGDVAIGSERGQSFAFDNECPRSRRQVHAFEIDSHVVSNGSFRRFVDAGGYERPELWGDRGGFWLRQCGRTMPDRWRRTARGDLEHRFYDRWLALPDDEPVVHVNAFEAEAYSRWAGRRLPTAAEWECAADRIEWGRSVWEWTADPFAPYVGFRPGPYTTYSTPWFHHQRELRGGAYTTHRLMHDRRYRNFFLPQRTDVFAGFRTAAS